MKPCMKRVSLVLVSACVTATLACHNPLGNGQQLVLGVDTLETPSTVASGGPLTVVLGVAESGCDAFERITEIRLEANIVLTAVGTNSALGNKDVACPAIYSLKSRSYQITAPFPDKFMIVVREPGSGPSLTANVQVQ